GGLSRGGGAAQLNPSTLAFEDSGVNRPIQPKDKIDQKLSKAKGQVEVQLWVTDLTPEVLKALEAKGLKIEDKDAKLKIIFGTCDAAKLLEIAAIAQVEKIKPLES
ncbi:MAG: hypothetical protein ABUL72_02025, partial [Armatimonadota bacterium]